MTGENIELPAGLTLVPGRSDRARDEQGNSYYRMRGRWIRGSGAGSEERAHETLDSLAELVAEAPSTVIVFPAEPPPWRRRLIEALNGIVEVDPTGAEPRLGRVEAVSERVESKACRIDGCPHRTEVLRGRYAGLCAEHRAELADQIKREHRENGGEKRGREKREPGLEGETLEAKARSLVMVSRQLDAASRKHRQTKGDLRSAIDSFNAGLRDLQASAKALLEA